jgi:hypothetical protein
MEEVKEVSEGQKLRIIQDSNKLRKMWNKLDREQKLKIFEGMDIATDYKWVLSLFEELKTK